MPLLAEPLSWTTLSCMLETFQPLRSVREHFHTWTYPDQLWNCACSAHQPSCFDDNALKHKCPQFMTKPLQTISTLSFLSLCRWQLLGVWRRAADPGARVHQDFGSVGIRDPGGPTLGPRLHLRHLLLQVGQLLEVQPPPKSCGVCLPEKHAGLEWHPQQCGRLFQGHLWYEATLVYWDLDNRHMTCVGAPHWVTIIILLLFQATPTLSEDDSIGNSTRWAWTRWRATLAMSVWIFLAVEMRELGCGESETPSPPIFWHWRGKSRIRLIQSDETVSLTFTPNVHTHQFQHLLRKIKVCFLRLGTSCAAIHIFILSEIWAQG